VENPIGPTIFSSEAPSNKLRVLWNAGISEEFPKNFTLFCLFFVVKTQERKKKTPRSKGGLSKKRNKTKKKSMVGLTRKLART
jgi:hypothetical protein